MNLLNSLLGDRQQQYLLLIGAYRDNEVTPRSNADQPGSLSGWHAVSW